jgi:hypothetical protein
MQEGQAAPAACPFSFFIACHLSALSPLHQVIPKTGPPFGGFAASLMRQISIPVRQPVCGAALKNALIVVGNEFKTIGHGTVAISPCPDKMGMKLFPALIHFQPHMHLHGVTRIETDTRRRNINRRGLLNIAVYDEFDIRMQWPALSASPL